MIIETKYSLGDEVWPIWRGRREVRTPCPMCGGVGWLEINSINEQCPLCYGRCHIISWEPEAWLLREFGCAVVGRVDATIYAPKHRPKYDDNGPISYMLTETGIGSGQIWYEQDLFPSREEALAACDIRNAGSE